jgi:hypothetical protein
MTKSSTLNTIMKSSKSSILPPDSVRDEASPRTQFSRGTSVNDAARDGEWESAEALRRKAYCRLARAIGFLDAGASLPKLGRYRHVGASAR